MMLRLGLIVNPLAGVGGRLALKGSDDRGLVDAALARGAARPAPERARAALAALPAEIEILTAGGAMGADIAGTPITPATDVSTGADTRAAAIALADAGVDLLLFAGGDGTAVDVLAALGDRLPVIGIPAGVKMHSAVFGVTPRHAGELAAAFAAGRVRDDAPAEVMDVHEADLRAGVISPGSTASCGFPSRPVSFRAARRAALRPRRSRRRQSPRTSSSGCSVAASP